MFSAHDVRNILQACDDKLSRDLYLIHDRSSCDCSDPVLFHREGLMTRWNNEKNWSVHKRKGADNTHAPDAAPEHQSVGWLLEAKKCALALLKRYERKPVCVELVSETRDILSFYRIYLESLTVTQSVCLDGLYDGPDSLNDKKEPPRKKAKR